MNSLGQMLSQFGEDRWIWERYDFGQFGIFVDVGASDGFTNSNSAFFEQLGWWCLCIEPDPRHWKHLKATRKVCEMVAVSSASRSAPFWLHLERPSRSSLIPPTDAASERTVVSTITLTALIEKYGVSHIDILDIDVEGHEIAVWNSLDLKKCRPSLVIIEYADIRPGAGFKEVAKAVVNCGYRIVHTTPANLILEDMHQPPNLRRL